MNDDVVMGLDIGTSATRAVIGERDDAGAFSITGVGKSPSTGLRKGVVVNIEAVVASVADAADTAQFMSGKTVGRCWIGAGAGDIESIISRGVVAVNGKNREISRDDKDRVRDIARAVDIRMDRQILDVIPLSYIVDNQRGIRDPLGMIGVRLESEVNIITGSLNSVQNLVRCVNRAGLVVESPLLQTLACGRAVLSGDEKELGVILIDLGAGSTNMLVYHQGNPYLTASVPAGGALVTSDIAQVEGIALETAEKIKLEAGCCWEPLLDHDEEIIAPGLGGRGPLSVPRSRLVEIIRPRMEETFLMLKKQLDDRGYGKPLGAGLVISGGGANMPGAADLAQEVFGMQARLGMPLPAGGLVEEYRDSAYATAVGLALEGYERSGGRADAPDRGAPPDAALPGLLSRFVGWIKRDFF